MEREIELSSARNILTRAANMDPRNLWLLDHIEDLAPRFVAGTMFDELTRLERLHECQQ